MGCYGTCDAPGEVQCLESSRPTCTTCCEEDLCNNDAFPILAYIDRCFDNPCQNGGTCSVNGQGVSCRCPPLYQGPTCEDLEPTTTPATTTTQAQTTATTTTTTQEPTTTTATNQEPTTTQEQTTATTTTTTQEQTTATTITTTQEPTTTTATNQEPTTTTATTTTATQEPTTTTATTATTTQEQTTTTATTTGTTTTSGPECEYPDWYTLGEDTTTTAATTAATATGEQTTNAAATATGEQTTTATSATTTTPTECEYPVWYNGGPCGVSKYLNAGVGLPAFNRIVGGNRTRPNEFPWQVLIKDWINETHYFSCGGMILNRYWILTAAHCVIKGGTPIVYFGEHDTTDATDVEFSALVKQTIRHRHYNNETYVNDIALHRLCSPLTFNPDVRPVCPPCPGESYTGAKGLVSGWGDIVYGQVGVTPVLQYTVMDVIDNKPCADKSKPYTITGGMLCAEDITDGSNSTFCDGDSGGPLVSKDPKNHFHAIGIVSNNVGCRSDYPAVFTRITEYLPWIDERMPMADRT